MNSWLPGPYKGGSGATFCAITHRPAGPWPMGCASLHASLPHKLPFFHGALVAARSPDPLLRHGLPTVPQQQEIVPQPCGPCHNPGSGAPAAIGTKACRIIGSGTAGTRVSPNSKCSLLHFIVASRQNNLALPTASRRSLKPRKNVIVLCDVLFYMMTLCSRQHPNRSTRQP